MTTRAFICGCAGLALGAEERAFIKDADPWGLILFRRNVESPGQVKRLAEVFRDLTGRAVARTIIVRAGGDKDERQKDQDRVDSAHAPSSRKSSAAERAW